MVKMKIGRKLESLRNRAGLSLQEVADKIDASKSTISHWENNKREPTFDMLDRLAEIYNTNIQNIFSNEDLEDHIKANFLDRIILELNSEGAFKNTGIDGLDQSSKQILLGALEQHINKLINK